MVALLAIHGVAAMIILLSKGPSIARPQADPIMVTLATEQRTHTAPAPKVPLQQAQLPTPVIPIIAIDVNEDPPPTAITVANVAQPAPTPAADANAPLLATTVEYIRPPVVIYPVAAKRAHATGTVQVRALVETDGQVRDARVHRSSGYELLDRAACESVRGALFKPYMLNGTPRTALVTVPVSYFLKDVRTASR